MKLLRWAVGGASVYVIYKYSIGRKAKGEDVFVKPEKAIAAIGKDEIGKNEIGKNEIGKDEEEKQNDPAADQADRAEAAE